MITWLILITNILIITAVTLFFAWNVYAIIVGAPYVPSSKKRIKTMIELAQLKQTDILLDVGSGDGRVLRAVAPHVEKAQGIEINAPLVWWSRAMNALRGIKNVRIESKNFWNTDISGADVVLVYCIDTKMKRLEEKFTSELKKGSRVVSNGFVLPTLPPTEQKEGVTLYVL